MRAMAHRVGGRGRSFGLPLQRKMGSDGAPAEEVAEGCQSGAHESQIHLDQEQGLHRHQAPGMPQSQAQKITVRKTATVFQVAISPPATRRQDLPLRFMVQQLVGDGRNSIVKAVRNCTDGKRHPRPVVPITPPRNGSSSQNAAKAPDKRIKASPEHTWLWRWPAPNAFVRG